jgi:hypothetical protein
MGIQITHNADGSITASCGDDELTFFPRRPRGGMGAQGPKSSSEAPISDPTWNPPIPAGAKHKAYVYVPVGGSAATDDQNSMPTFDWIDPVSLELELSALLRDGSKARASSSPIPVRVRVGTGEVLNIKDLVSAANETIRSQSLQFHIINEPIIK